MIVFTVTILPISVLFTWLYDHTNDSLLLASLFHAAINVTESVLIIGENEGRLLLLVSSVLTAAVAVILIVKSGSDRARPIVFGRGSNKDRRRNMGS